MKSLDISTKSWHFRFMDWMSAIPYYERYSVNHHGWDRTVVPMDTCSYIQLFIGTAIKFLTASVLMVVAGLAVLFAFADFLAWMIAVMVHGWIVPDPAVVLIALIFGGVTLSFALMGIGKAIKKAANVVTSETSTSELYKSFKEKSCRKINFVKE